MRIGGRAKGKGQGKGAKDGQQGNKRNVNGQRDVNKGRQTKTPKNGRETGKS
jgi:hypothetical protein